MEARLSERGAAPSIQRPHWPRSNQHAKACDERGEPKLHSLQHGARVHHPGKDAPAKAT